MTLTGRVPERADLRPARPAPVLRRPRAVAWRWFLLGGGLLAAVTVFLPPSSDARWIPVVVGVLAVVAVAEGSLAQLRTDGLRGGLVREPLVLIGLGLCLTVAGEVLRAQASASMAYTDGVSLAAYPFYVAGMVRLTRVRLKEGTVDTLLVAAIAPASICAFAWLPLVEAIGRWSDGDASSSWRLPLFLAVDALAVAIIARLATTFRGRPVAYQFLLGASACLLGAHVSRAVSDITQVVPAPLGSQTLLVAGFALFGAAALHPSVRRGRGQRTRVVTIGRGHVALLLVTVVVGPAIALVRYGDRGTWVVLVAAGPALVSVLVVAHLSRMITERQRLEFAFSHDALTGLANRSRFTELLTLALEQTASRRRGLAVMFIDLDRFKNVNDDHGHDVGDELLRGVAGRLRDCVRAGDVVARLSGDEFAVLIVSERADEAADEASRRLLQGFSHPLHVGQLSLDVTLSIGTAYAPQHGEDADTLLRNADSAMYVAKASGRNNAQVYREGMQTRAHQRRVVETRLREAIDNRELALHYQPKLDAATAAIVGVEALVRWDHPSHGLIPPGAFMNAAEESGLIAPLGAWVLDTACRQGERWRRDIGADLSVSVNLSARQFELQDVPTLVASALAQSGLPARLLELELTESLRLDDERLVADSLHRLEALGVRCSIDDFGTGYSNISYLHAYPIDTVKLDRSFLTSVTGPGTDSPLVRGVIALAHSLGMRVVAEGVETPAQLAFLQQHRCDQWQGFLFSPGVPAAEMTALLERGAVPVEMPASRAAAGPSGAAWWDEKRLREVLWSELGVVGLHNRSEEESDDPRHRGVVLTGASGVMALPVFLGLGSAGGLPPALQTQLDATLTSFGAVASQGPGLVGDSLLAEGETGSGSGATPGGARALRAGAVDPASLGLTVGDSGLEDLRPVRHAAPDAVAAAGDTIEPLPEVDAAVAAEPALYTPVAGSTAEPSQARGNPPVAAPAAGHGRGSGAGTAPERGSVEPEGPPTALAPPAPAPPASAPTPAPEPAAAEPPSAPPPAQPDPGPDSANGNGNGNGNPDPGPGNGNPDPGPGNGNGNGNGNPDPGPGNGNGNGNPDPGPGNGNGNGNPDPGPGNGNPDPGPGSGNGNPDPGPGSGNGNPDPGPGSGNGNPDPGPGNGNGNGNGHGA